jgi:glycosyltransferase involved in cell wall biosynthesis
MTTETLELTILMPCLNEAETVVTCIQKARGFLDRSGIHGEVLIADNGSTDGSQTLATSAGARVAPIPGRGYGAALIGGIAAAKGRFVIMGDADDSYDFSCLDAFVAKLREGHPLVMGNRFTGGIMPGAMPPLHRYLGNPVLSFIGRLLFRSPIGDFHCGLRGFDRQAVLDLKLASTGMEFASEMIVKATLAGFDIAEVPTILQPDGRSRPPHLRSWRDGWRHLRFLLMMSPRWLLLYPGLSLFGLGTMLSALIFFRPIDLGGIGLDIHTMLYAAGASILGLQLMLFALLTRGVGVLKRVLPSTSAYSGFLRSFSLEKGIILGLGIFLAGLGLAGYSVALWSDSGLATLEPRQIMRIVIPSVTLLVAGAEIVFASFILSFMDPLSAANPRPNDLATNEGKHQT